MKSRQGLYGALRVGLLLHVEAREEHRIQIDIVDDLIVVAADVFHVVPRLGAEKRRDGLAQSAPFSIASAAAAWGMR